MTLVSTDSGHDDGARWAQRARLTSLDGTEHPGGSICQQLPLMYEGTSAKPVQVADEPHIIIRDHASITWCCPPSSSKRGRPVCHLRGVGG